MVECRKGQMRFEGQNFDWAKCRNGHEEWTKREMQIQKLRIFC